MQNDITTERSKDTKQDYIIIIVCRVVISEIVGNTVVITARYLENNCVFFHVVFKKLLLFVFVISTIRGEQRFS